MSRSQPGILQPPAASGTSLTLRLELEVDAQRALERLRELDVSPGVVVGLGEPLVRALGKSVPGLRAFPSLGGAVPTPSTQQALWALVSGADRTTVYDRARALEAALAGPFVLDDSLDTFTYRGGRDLTGYEDGTANPSAEASPGVAFAADGSSFVAVQRWRHDLARFRAHSQAQRDHLIGRRLADNEELADAPRSAHVQRTAQELFEPTAFMVRRSMPWAAGAAEGLLFVAYGRSFDAYERVLRRMVGLDDGLVDALFTFSRALTGGYYWCPPLRSEARLDLGVLGVTRPATPD